MQAILVALLLSQPVCLFGHPPAVADEWQRSSMVLVGTVLDERATNDTEGFLAFTTYQVRIDERLRGTPHDTVLVVSENDSGRFPMTVHVQYLLFLYEGEKGLAVDNCGNSGPVTMTQSTLRAVRALAAGHYRAGAGA